METVTLVRTSNESAAQFRERVEIKRSILAAKHKCKVTAVRMNGVIKELPRGGWHRALLTILN